MSLHPTALISDNADLGSNVTVGPYAIIEEGVVVGENCMIAAAAQLRRGTRIGKNNKIGSGSILSADPQSVTFDSTTESGVEIGDDNELREYVTIHRSTEEGNSSRIGNGNYLMTGAHLGHDSIIGDENVMANNVLLGGHVTVGNRCFFGGGSVYHQFVRIGDYVMVQGLAGMSLDMPPYVIAAGVNSVAGINSVGLRRAGFDGHARKEIKEIFRQLYREGKTIPDLLSEIEGKEVIPEMELFFQFLRDPSKKGVCVRFGNQH